ncbi:MAG TPA: YdcF family protein [Candidatus Limnocylindrales bacterium]|nr:YdcF family protein [Candidatus Limnocylindrales bacterium]
MSRPVDRRPAVQTLALLVAGLAIGGAALIGYTAWQIAVQGARDERQRADAIVVLGAAQFNGTPGGVFEARLRHAVDLYNDHVADYLVVTGGKLPGDRTTEAATARKWAIQHGVPADRILGEFEGRSTLESLEAVEAIFRDHGFTSAVFVSDRTHMLRVLRMATDLGITGWGSPTETSPTDLETGRRAQAMVHEIGGLLAYYVGGGRLIADSASVASP